MKTQIIMTSKMLAEIQKKLFPPNNDAEQFGFIITGLSEHGQGYDLLCRQFIYADESCLISQSGISVVPNGQFVKFVYNAVRECKGGLITVHTHPFSNDHVSFSGIDDRSEAISFPKEVELLGKGPHASVVFGRNSVDARWYNAQTRRIEPITAIKIIGENGTKSLTPTSYRNIHNNDLIDETHDRQVLAFGKAGQKLIQKKTVGIGGCGGIGSILFIQLVRLGVKKFKLIDDDVVERSNLNRLAGSRLRDVITPTPKVEMLKNYGLEINDAIRIDAIAESLFSSNAQKTLKSCDFIFGCIDTQAPRVLLNSLSSQHLIPYIDCGTGLQATPDHTIEHAGGQVRTVIPGLGCLLCIKGINLDTANMERMPKEKRQFVIERGYIAGADEHAPSVASLNGVIANLAVTEFMGYVTGCKSLSRYLFYDFLKSTTMPVEFPKNPDCFTCSEDSLLGSGDSGVALPDYLVSKHPPNPKGDMMSTTQKSIEQLLINAQERNLKVRGSAEERWFAIDGIKLDPRFNVPETPVMIRFPEATNTPVIFIPETVSLRPDADIADTFMDDSHHIEGWQAIFPNLFLDVDGDVIVLLFSLAGVLANLSLYNLVSMESIEIKNGGGDSDSDSDSDGDGAIVGPRDADGAENS